MKRPAQKLLPWAFGAFFLLPLLFRRWLSFQSGFTWGWAACYVALGAALLARAKVPGLLKATACVPFAFVCLGLTMNLLSAALGATAQYWVENPEDGSGQYAQVTIVDPGAMGRVRYRAVEQQVLVDLYPLLRIGLVTGVDSAPSGRGKYGYLVDRYFEENP